MDQHHSREGKIQRVLNLDVAKLNTTFGGAFASPLKQEVLLAIGTSDGARTLRELSAMMSRHYGSVANAIYALRHCGIVKTNPRHQKRGTLALTDAGLSAYVLISNAKTAGQ